MKVLREITIIAVVMLALGLAPVFAQGGHHGGGHMNPDSLTLVTVSGTAIVDTSMMYPMYYLDEDGDGNADYFLNFGPPWYQPDSSGATRPNDGDAITIYGGMHDPVFNSGNLPVIIVYEINGLFWRDPYDPFWNNMGHHSGGHQGGGCHHAFGWMHDTLEVVSLTGIAMVDTTFMFNHYYLDEDQDGLPDYYLNFGPPWYQPSSGATRPNDGDLIDIVGGKIDVDSLPLVIVYEINGLLWRDSTQIGPHFGGGWIHRNMTHSQYIHTPWDSLTGMHINPGWHHGGGHHGGMMPDSAFCQMLQLFPQNMPGGGVQNGFAGFEIGIFNPNGQNMMMWPMMGGHISFNNQVQIQLHYNEIQLQGFNIDENTIEVKAWDESSSSWVPVSSAVVNTADNTVTLSSNDLSSYYILTGQQLSLGVDDQQSLILKGFALEQNYPNPFNPSTSIRFRLNRSAQVRLSVYNVLGQKVVDLLNQRMDAGEYAIDFDASGLTSGIYFYELNVDGQSQVRKMNLMK